MADRDKTGKSGEQLVADFVSQNGWVILHQNWRWKRYEIDLVLGLENVIVFAEVKTQKRLFYDHPAPLVSPDQQKRLITAAQAYMIEFGYDGAIRFDVFRVILPDSEPAQIEHFADAFFPGLG
ncbi:MAG: YraN family protein [Bacteroidota bacterium]